MSVTLNAGSGGATCGTDTVSGTPNVDYQIVKIGYSVSGTTPTQVSASNPLPVAFQSAQAVLQSGSWTVSISGTVTVSGTVTANIGTTNGLALDATVSGLQVAQGSTTSGQKGGLALGAVTISAPSYTTGQSSPLSLTPAGALRTDASATTQPVSAASLPLPTGAATAAKQPALGAAGAPSADVITVQGVAAMTALKVDGSGVTQPVSGTFWQATQPISGTVTANAGAGTFAVNLSQVAGSAIALGQTTMAASLPVTIANNQSALPAVQSGPWTVQPGNTANTTPWLVNDIPTSANGTSVFSFLSTGAVQASNIKAAAGTIYSAQFFNSGSSPQFARLYDKATAPGTGDTPIWRGMIPGNTGAAGFVVQFKGLKTSTGIGIRVTGAVADNDATALTANAIMGNVEYL